VDEKYNSGEGEVKAGRGIKFSRRKRIKEPAELPQIAHVRCAAEEGPQVVCECEEADHNGAEERSECGRFEEPAKARLEPLHPCVRAEEGEQEDKRG